MPVNPARIVNRKGCEDLQNLRQLTQHLPVIVPQGSATHDADVLCYHVCVFCACFRKVRRNAAFGFLKSLIGSDGPRVTARFMHKSKCRITALPASRSADHGRRDFNPAGNIVPNAGVIARHSRPRLGVPTSTFCHPLPASLG